MREIKFRGKRVDSEEWVYGDLLQPFNTNDKQRYYILDYSKFEYDCFEHIGEVAEEFEVIPETIGQFTGLFDKNGKEIYEGDIVRNNKNTLLLKTGYVKLVNGSYLLLDEEDDDFDFISNWCIEKEAYIIGNIHDNKDLLK